MSARQLMDFFADFYNYIVVCFASEFRNIEKHIIIEGDSLGCSV